MNQASETQFEKKLHLPTAFVEVANGWRREGGLVGQEHKRLPGLGVLEADAPEMGRVILAAAVAVQCDGLVGNHTAGTVGGRRIDSMGVKIGFGAGHEKAPA